MNISAFVNSYQKIEYCLNIGKENPFRMNYLYTVGTVQRDLNSREILKLNIIYKFIKYLYFISLSIYNT